MRRPGVPGMKAPAARAASSLLSPPRAARSASWALVHVLRVHWNSPERRGLAPASSWNHGP